MLRLKRLCCSFSKVFSFVCHMFAALGWMVEKGDGLDIEYIVDVCVRAGNHPCIQRALEG